MTRINVYSKADEYEDSVLLGWFDPQSAERFDQDTRWDGNNMVGVITGSQWVDEYLYRTKGGRWVLNHDARRYCNGPDTYEFITDEQARDWLLRSECNDEAVERFFGEIDEERGPGRPEIGPAVHVRFSEDLLAMVDAYAAGEGIKRAEAIRRLTQDAVTRARVAATAPLSAQVNRLGRTGPRKRSAPSPWALRLLMPPASSAQPGFPVACPRCPPLPAVPRVLVIYDAVIRRLIADEQGYEDGDDQQDQDRPQGQHSRQAPFKARFQQVRGTRMRCFYPISLTGVPFGSRT